MNENNILNIKYEFLELPLILSFHISILKFEELKSYLDIINYYCKGDIFIQNININLIGIILQKSQDHYVTLFKNKNEDFNTPIDSWCYYDDISGIIEIFDGNKVGYTNIINSYPSVLAVYKKNKSIIYIIINNFN